MKNILLIIVLLILSGVGGYYVNRWVRQESVIDPVKNPENVLHNPKAADSEQHQALVELSKKQSPLAREEALKFLKSDDQGARIAALSVANTALASDKALILNLQKCSK